MRHQRSVGLDSLASSAAPPGYTSQQDATSFVAKDSDEDDDEEQVALNLSPPPPPPLMDSPYRDPSYTAPLPSPYSIEDLRLAAATQSSADHHQNPRSPPHRSPTRRHGYSHNYTPVFNSRSLSSPNVHHTGATVPTRSSSYYPPLPQRDQPRTCDDLTCYSPSHIISTDDIFSAQPRSSTEEHLAPPSVQAENQLRHHPTAPYTPSPPRHRRQHSGNPPPPPPIRTLTYPYNAYAEYEGDDTNQHRSALNNMTLSSTATILSPPEEPSGRRRRQSLPVEWLGPLTTRGIKNLDHSLPPPPPLTQTQTQLQPTNHVHLSRKCNPSIPVSKSWGWSRKTPQQPITQIPPPRLSSSSSALTGVFVINPELYIPSSLLNAMEGPVFRFKPSSDRGETRRKTNLKLEIENGGIDVDIRLVPSTTLGDQAQAGPSASTATFTPTSTHPRKSSTSSAQSSALARAVTLRDKRKPNQPTIIDLRIKQTIQNEDLVPSPLIARIHAPNPRPPFHLSASTVDIITKSLPVPNTRQKENQPRASTSSPTTTFTVNNPATSEPALITNSLPSPNRTNRSLSKSRPQRRLPSVPSSRISSITQLDLTSSPSCLSSSSPLYLHLPRTFRGPLTIQISSGHIGDRLRLSAGLEKEAALIRESEFGRGYFVGGLEGDLDRRRGEEEGEGEGEEEMGNDDTHVNEKGTAAKGSTNSRQQVVVVANNINENQPQQQQPPSPHEDSSSSSSLASSPSSSSSSTTLPGRKEKRWSGDRIEILVGSGDVYLQFEDEDEADDPFGTRSLRKEAGFWKRFTKKFFFL